VNGNPDYNKKLLKNAIQKWLRRAKERRDAELKKMEAVNRRKE